MADYFVELSQIGSSGRVTFLTNFGFGFTSELIERPTVPKKSRSTRLLNTNVPHRDRVIRLISNCHGAALDLISDKEWTDNGMEITFSAYYCYVCGVRSEYPHEFINQEYPAFTDNTFHNFMSCAVIAGVDELDAVLIVEKLLSLVETIWSRTQAGERVRAVLRDYRGELEL